MSKILADIKHAEWLEDNVFPYTFITISPDGLVFVRIMTKFVIVDTVCFWSSLNANYGSETAEVMLNDYQSLWG